MAVHPVERKLAGIFAADIAGYSRLMAGDEVGTLARLKACSAIVDGLMEQGSTRSWKGVMAALWDETVVRPLERLSVESAGDLPEDIRPANLVPFARRGPA